MNRRPLIFLLTCLSGLLWAAEGKGSSGLQALLEPLPEDVTNPMPGMAYRQSAPETSPSQSLERVLDPLHRAAAVSRPSLQPQPDTGVPNRTETPVAVRVHFSDYADTLTALLEERLESGPGLEISPAQPVSPLTLRSHAWELELLSLPPHSLRSRMVVEIRFMVAGIEEARLSLALHCRLMRPVYFPGKKLQRGDTLNSSDFALRDTDLLQNHSRPVTSETDLSLYELTRSIEVDRPLLWRDLTEIPAVRKGQVVEVNIREGLLNISMKAVALQNGLKGDLIRLRNLRTNKEIQALVTNENEIRVYF